MNDNKGLNPDPIVTKMAILNHANLHVMIPYLSITRKRA
jgi:hypothetical protein